MVDYAFLSGLAGKRDWNAIRAEKRAETDYLSAINQLKEQQVEKLYGQAFTGAVETYGKDYHSHWASLIQL